MGSGPSGGGGGGESEVFRNVLVEGVPEIFPACSGPVPDSTDTPARNTPKQRILHSIYIIYRSKGKNRH